MPSFLSGNNMQEYLKLLEKYECKLIDGKIINKNGKNTRILWSPLNSPTMDIAVSTLNEEGKKENLDALEGFLKLVYDV